MTSEQYTISNTDRSTANAFTVPSGSVPDYLVGILSWRELF